MLDLYDKYTKILTEELEVATGCTEPISIAYASAKAREILNCFPDKIHIIVSKNILKNALGVTIPNTKLRGVYASSILGIICGKADKKLSVLENINKTHIEQTHKLLQTNYATLETTDSQGKLYVEITAYKNNNYARVIIKDSHTNIIKIVKNDKILLDKTKENNLQNQEINRNILNIKNIYEYATNIDLKDVKPILEQQIEYNYNIAKHGLNNSYGLNVGSTLLNYNECIDIAIKAKAYAAAASDARMSGANLPVVTNSGSGNQGITASVPLIVYAKEKNITSDKLFRALTLSNLIAIYIKTKIGRLSAFCGVIVAATGCACGLSYLKGGNITQIENTIKNMLANISGIFCDGAKPTCAEKIASSVDAAFQASLLAMKNINIDNNFGIIFEDIEETINNIGEIGLLAMNETDKKIIEIMTKKIK